MKRTCTLKTMITALACLAALLAAGCGGGDLSEIHIVQYTNDTGGAVDTTSPTVSSFSPANGATNVASDGTVFKVIFSESMDTTVNLNTQATLTASGFSVTLQRQDTGGSTTINAANALNYGTFSWTTTTVSNDTLAFTLKSSATLTGAGLDTLASGKTYNITSHTVPSNLKDTSGNALSSTGISSTGSFTTL